MAILNLEPETQLSTCRKNAFAFLALFVLILMTYSNTFNASWHFDDEPNILKRESLHLNSLRWEDIKKTFFVASNERMKLYRPAACSSFALNYYFGQKDVFGYHVVNLTIHFLASVFLFLFVYQLLNLPRLREKYGQHAYSLALLTTVLWAINPIQTQGVTYIVQRMASMAGMFYIMSMYFYVKGRTSKNASARITYYLCSLLAALLAFFSKENAVLLPISIFLIDLFLIQGLERKNIVRNLYFLSALVLVFITIVFMLRGPSVFSLTSLIESYGGREFTLGERLLTQPRVLLLYLSLIFYPMPHRLSISHDISISHGFFEPPSTALAILFIGLILALSVLKSRKWPLLAYCILFFFLNHLLESSVIPLELVFEHRNYIPTMLLFVPVAILMLEGLRFFSYKKFMMTILYVFFVLIFVVLGHSTFMRNFSWRTEESLWLSAVDRSPNLARPYHNLGRYYGSLGDRDKEVACYAKALGLGIESHGETRQLTHYNLGLAYKELHQEEKAIEHFRKAFEIDPRFSDAHNNLAAILVRNREYEAAFDHLITALTYDKKLAVAHHNLGIVLLKQRRLDEALSEFHKASAMNRNFSSALPFLGVIYKYKNEFPRAKYYFQKTLEKNDKDIMTRLHLVETLYHLDEKTFLVDFLAETLDLIPPEKLMAFIDDVLADRFPDQETPDTSVILPLFGKAYLKKSEELSDHGKRLMEK